jgi:hypothetical protein
VKLRWRHEQAGWPGSSRGMPSGAGGVPSVSGLSFHRAPGPLLAAVGLCGGAGVSALAYLIAATAAAQSQAPVLLADTGGPTAGVAAYAGVSAPLTLADISDRVAGEERVPPRFWADGEHGLRVLAGEPQFTVQGTDQTVRRVLGDAREVHGLTVVDAGTLARPADQAVLALATHIVWVLPANGSAVARAHRVLERITRLSRPEILLARADPAGGRPPLGALADLADHRRAAAVDALPGRGGWPSASRARGRGWRDAASARGAPTPMNATVNILRRRDFWVLSGVLCAVTLVAALMVGIGFPAQARSVLAVHFASLPRSAGVAGAIWLHNARATAGVAVFAAARPLSRRLLDGARPVWDRAIVTVCDVIVGGWAVGSSLVAGVLLGAYGTRQLAVFLPDGPVELTAWLLLVLLYLDVRGSRASLQQAAGRLAVILGLLGVAAILELWAGA